MYHGSVRVRTGLYVYIPWYHGTKLVRTIGTYHWYVPHVPVVRTVHVYYVRSCDITFLNRSTYMCTNITLSQKRLEVQALSTMVLEYHGTMVPGMGQYVRTIWYVRTYNIISKTYVRTRLPWYTCTMVPLVRTCVQIQHHHIISKTYQRTYLKRLEIQALRCNGESSGRCQHRRHHGILRFPIDSDVCSADLHHNPRKHVGLHAHQRLHRLP